MPRQPRLLSATDTYHIMNHCVEGTQLFIDDSDRQFFLKSMKQRISVAGGSLYAWCLMGNHFHALVRLERGALSAVVKQVSSDYASRFNWKHGRKGHLFMQRFKSEPVEDEPYFLTVVRYIHQNPVKAFMCESCSDYRWSSFNEFMGITDETTVERDFVLACFGGIEGFAAFHGSICYEDACIDIPLFMSDEEAIVFAKRLLGEETFSHLGELPKPERDDCLRRLKQCLIPLKQITRITGMSYAKVRNA